MDEALMFEDIFKSLIQETKEIELVYDYVLRYNKDDSYAEYNIRKLNGESPFSFKGKIQKLGKEGLATLNAETSKLDYENRIEYLEEIKEGLLGLRYDVVKDDVLVYEENEYGLREEHHFKSFRNPKIIPFSTERQNGDKKSILFKASDYAKEYLEAIEEIARKIDFIINQMELLPEPKNAIKDKNTVRVFYSWQSDKEAPKKLIRKALGNITKDFKSKGKTIIVESDSRGIPGSQDIPNTLFSKIEKSDVFIADVNFVGSNTYKDAHIHIKKYQTQM